MNYPAMSICLIMNLDHLYCTVATKSNVNQYRHLLFKQKLKHHNPFLRKLNLKSLLWQTKGMRTILISILTKKVIKCVQLRFHQTFNKVIDQAPNKKSKEFRLLNFHTLTNSPIKKRL